jgi:hypothetical protein
VFVSAVAQLCERAAVRDPQVGVDQEIARCRAAASLVPPAVEVGDGWAQVLRLIDHQATELVAGRHREVFKICEEGWVKPPLRFWPLAIRLWRIPPLVGESSRAR